jgi:predicted glycogen debranching enzyme
VSEVSGPVRRLPAGNGEQDILITREWLVANGLGGYASGTLGGTLTRRYHALLVAALPVLGRTVMLNQVSEELVLEDGRQVTLSSAQPPLPPPGLPPSSYLEEFRLEYGLPSWRYRVGEALIEKTLLLPHQQNSVHVTYRLLEGEGALRLRLHLAIHMRQHEAPVDAPDPGPYLVTAKGRRYEIDAADEAFPPLRLFVYGEDVSLTLAEQGATGFSYALEKARGYEHVGGLWHPGYLAARLLPDRPVILMASTESWDLLLALDPKDARQAELDRRRRLLALSPHAACSQGIGPELVLAADSFLISPAGRAEDAARAHAAGDEVRTVIAGYHWFTDWGRDTMISLEGLTLTTGRAAEGGYILRTFAHYIRDGLIPNLFPEGAQEGRYHTADATLWFFQALHRYVELTCDRETLAAVLPRLVEVAEHHERGTRFGIRVDPADGLLAQGESGYQLTWMDAKVGDWVVTPRRGKAVEINGLWYNALRLLEGWLADSGDPEGAARWAARAERCRKSFNQRFWFEEGGHLYDVVDGEDGDDDALRPNQLLSFSLAHPVLDQGRWAAVLEKVRAELVTPVGLRSLARDHDDYKPAYFGDLRARDAAYHQGTVWGWLIGPLVDAWLRVHPEDRAGARRFLTDFAQHLDEAGVGTISEVFDAEPPFAPRGCISQAWSVAEVLRCWVRTGE